MKSPKKPRPAQDSLRKRADHPIKKSKAMQINSATTIPFLPVTAGLGTAKTATTPSTNSDQAVMNTSASTFASLVEEAKSYPEVRSSVVEAYKSAIASGKYPSDQVMAGLAKTLSDLVE
jgi:anti-sigma28 factor (negative regulator of flagellin synthesis)